MTPEGANNYFGQRGGSNILEIRDHTMSMTESDRVLKTIEILMNYFIRLCVFACGHEREKERETGGGENSLRQEY